MMAPRFPPGLRRQDAVYRQVDVNLLRSSSRTTAEWGGPSKPGADYYTADPSTLSPSTCAGSTTRPSFHQTCLFNSSELEREEKLMRMPSCSPSEKLDVPPKGPSALLFLVFNGFLSCDKLTEYSRLRNLAAHQVRDAIAEAERKGERALRRFLGQVDSKIQQSHRMALFNPIQTSNISSPSFLHRADILPDISTILNSDPWDPCWIRHARQEELRNNIRSLCQLQQSLNRSSSATRAGRVLPSGYERGSFVPAVYESEIPRYRAIRCSLSTMRINQLAWQI